MITFSSLQTDYHLAAPAITQEIAQKDPEEEFYSEGGGYQIHLSRERDLLSTFTFGSMMTSGAGGP